MNIMRLIITKTRILFPDLCGFQYQFCLMIRHIGNKKKRKETSDLTHLCMFVCLFYLFYGIWCLGFFAIIHNNPSHIHTL